MPVKVRALNRLPPAIGSSTRPSGSNAVADAARRYKSTAAADPGPGSRTGFYYLRPAGCRSEPFAVLKKSQLSCDPFHPSGPEVFAAQKHILHERPSCINQVLTGQDEAGRMVIALTGHHSSIKMHLPRFLHDFSPLPAAACYLGTSCFPLVSHFKAFYRVGNSSEGEGFPDQRSSLLARHFGGHLYILPGAPGTLIWVVPKGVASYVLVKPKRCLSHPPGADSAGI